MAQITTPAYPSKTNFYRHHMIRNRMDRKKTNKNEIREHLLIIHLVISSCLHATTLTESSRVCSFEITFIHAFMRKNRLSTL